MKPTILIVLCGVLTTLLAAPIANAVDKCSVKINSKTGALEIDATAVGASARWGTHAGFNPMTEGIAFFDDANCCSSGKCKKCHVGGPGTLAERTHPATCHVCVTELVGGTECCTYPQGCITGIRLRDGSFAASDPRFEAIEAVGPDTLRFTTVNVQVIDGSGDTGGTTNGRGNLIVGYNANAVGSGSHNLVVGDNHTYSSFGGLIAGTTNRIEAPYASVCGGNYNTAMGNYSSVGGGSFNEASGNGASVSGGRYNAAAGYHSSVSGGAFNTADGDFASVSGGTANVASGESASVTGGASNVASGESASVSGGASNSGAEIYSSVSGGAFNSATANSASVSGGIGNIASGIESSVSGGKNNSAVGNYSSVSGGVLITENAHQGWSAGSVGPTAGPSRFFSH